MNFILENIIHLANILYLLSYLVRDMLWLRIFTIVAGSSLLPYYYSRPEPLWEAIAWNVVFISINIFQSIIIFKERRPVHLQGDELKLYELSFDRLTPRHFKQLIAQGDWKEMEAEQVYVSGESSINTVTIIFEGEMVVKKADKAIANLKPGHFVGEMSFLTKKKACADVVTATSTRVVSWNFETLDTFLPKHPELRAAFQNILGADLVKKLNAA